MATIRPLPGLNAGQTLQARAMSEAELQQAVMDLAGLLGYHRHHDRPAPYKDQKRYATHVAGEAGFPDVVLAGGSRVIAWELKAHRGKLSPLQVSWLNAWDLCGAHTWDKAPVKPADWLRRDVEKVLRLYAPTRTRR